MDMDMDMDMNMKPVLPSLPLFKGWGEGQRRW